MSAPDSTPRLPELLAPAGSPEALEAALGAGADAVYLGGSSFNARMNAHNFSSGELREAVTSAHRLGGRIYLTLNTLIWDRELTDAVRAAYDAAAAGVDGLIIADVGAAALIRASLPGLPLHASTQLSGHNAAIGRVLADRGFSRFVIARETRLCDLRAAVRDNPLEVEVFIHGALCVCTSGQCLFSSLVGGRSGNRGECAQPCRLPYGKDAYPLSLKDLSLSAHVPALIDAGVASLKIEGRMKSPGYVAGVTSIWRRLLDERRAATPDEVERLSALFSRGGFTDGYFTGKIDHRMTGVRTAEDKEKSADAEKSNDRPSGFLPVTMTAEARAGQPIRLTASAPRFRWDNTPAEPVTVTVTVTGDVPDTARNPEAAMTADALASRLAKTGGTAYAAAAVRADVDPGLLLPVSRINALRRETLDALDKARTDGMPVPAAGYVPPVLPPLAPPAAEAPEQDFTARFHRPGQITPDAARFFSICWLPLENSRVTDPAVTWGVLLPPTIFDRESAAVRGMLTDALTRGCRHVMIANPGHLSLVKEAVAAAAAEAGVPMPTLHGDFRLNVTNRIAAEAQQEMAQSVLGVPYADVLFSPELTLPRVRDLCRALPGTARVITYGRIPLMLLEKCVIRELYKGSDDPAKPDGRSGAACAACARDSAVLRDRTGAAFPVLRTYDHRNVVYNSLPVSMTDRPDALAGAGVRHQHFIFSCETPTEVDAVIRAAREGRPVGGDVRRIK